MQLKNKKIFEKGNLKFAVIGHIEWINFLKVDLLPKPGFISHAYESIEFPAGGGTLIAKTLKELTNNEVYFFTSLGKDFYGEESFKKLSKMGLNLEVAWRKNSTRKGFSLTDNKGERAITVVGDRLQPRFNDNLNWNLLNDVDGIFITAGDKEIIKKARSAKIICASPRIGLEVINESKVLLDCLIGSNLDPGESYELKELNIKPKLVIKTEGKDGGIIFPGGRYSAEKNMNPIIDSYGCGDSFAAGILYGLTSQWHIENTIKLGKVLGRNCSEHFGPYPSMEKIFL